MKRLYSLFTQFLNHSLTKSSIIVLVGSMTANFSAYIYHLLVGRILGPDKYGELSSLLSLVYILNVPAQGLQTVLTKYFSGFKARKQDGKTKSLFISTTKGMVILEVAAFVALVPFINILADFLHITSKEYFIWLYLGFSTYLISVIQLSVFQAYQMFFIVNVFVNIGAVLRVVSGVIGSMFGVGMTLLSNVFSNFIMYLFDFYPLKFLMKADADKISLNKRGIISYSIPTLITTLGITALYSQDVILVKHFFSAGEAGIYSSLSVLGKVIFYASSSLGFVFFPVVAERSELKESHSKLVLYGLATIAFISLILTSCYFIFPKIVVDLLFGKAFYGAIPYLGYFGLFISFFSLSSLLFNVCLAAGKTTVWTIAIFGALAQTVLINIFHTTLFSIVMINLVVSASLFFLLLIYYSYAKEVRN